MHRLDNILKDFKSVRGSGHPYDYCDPISLVTYLASLTEEEIIATEIETASNLLHCSLKALYKNQYEVIDNILKEGNQHISLTEELSGNSYTIFVRDTWLFGVILINSLKHGNLGNNKEKLDVDLLSSFIEHIIKKIDVAKPLALHLLRTLLFIVTKCVDTLSPNLIRVILKHMSKVALSPITSFRQYTRGISKAVIPYLPEDEAVLDVSLLPVRGVNMYDIVKRFPKTYVRENQHNIIKKVLNMFQRNVESKEGGALYECVLFYSFEDWSKEIWPLFFEHLKCIDYEGEFFQSLLKYWVPMNVSIYKSMFYNFVRAQAIDWKVKGFILLECKKRGCTLDEDIIKSDTLKIAYSVETRDLGLMLASTYHKKSLWPKDYETDVVMNYLYSNIKLSLEEEETRSLHMFFSQVFLYVHIEPKKNLENFPRYMSIMERIYKYCRAALETDFFEVGAGIVFLLWTIATGCDKKLLLNYKLEKKDCYPSGENLFYKTLNENHKWWCGDDIFQKELTNCFLRNSGSNCLTKIFTKCLDINTMITIDLKTIVHENCFQTNLESEKMIKNYSEIVFNNDYCTNYNLLFLEQIHDFLVHFKIPQSSCFSEDTVFKGVLYLEVLMVAVRYNKFDKQKLDRVVENALTVVENIITNKNASEDANYKMKKIMEAFINNVVLCMTENSDALWSTLNKEKVINHLIFIIHRGNMKRPVSLSAEALKRFGCKMNESDEDKNYKIQFLNETLKSLHHQIGTRVDLKIRRNPESRLVIHAMCVSDNSLNKPLLKWVMTYLIEVIRDPNTPDSAVASALHTMEFIISDNSSQNPTLPFISDLIVQCVELFARRSWVVRNADLQLTRAIIDRFYGVCLDVCNRPKCIEDLIILFPKLSSYFYGILSQDMLDERAVLVFQFFSESQIKEHIYAAELYENSVGCFPGLFMEILQKYPNHYGRMAARSFSALCYEKDIPRRICSIALFCKSNFMFISKNIFTNFMYLLQQLYEKYNNSFQNSINSEGMRVINFAINDLLRHLKEHDTQFYDCILLKIKSKDEVSRDFGNNLNVQNFQNRLWLHNNIPFLLIHAKVKEIGSILRKVLSNRLLSCMQIKILTVLVSRFENNEFDRDVLKEILEILFDVSISVDDNDNYLLNCYFKTVLLFYQSYPNFGFKNKVLQFQVCRNYYKLMILVLYFSEQTHQLSVTSRQNFYNLICNAYSLFMSMNDELKNDITSTLAYLQRGAPSDFQLRIFKLIFQSCLFTSTHLEAYKCMSLLGGKSYFSFLSALEDFFSVQNLILHLKDESRVADLFCYMREYVIYYKQVLSDGYYSEESDILIPRSFLVRLINYEIKNS